jgi:hypothetical protein
VERRNEVRVPVDTLVSVTVLEPPSQAPFRGVLVDIAGKSLSVDLAFPIPSGTPVKLETDDLLLLAEVLRCQPHGEFHRLALTLKHSLDLLVLERLNRALRGEEPDEVLDPSPAVPTRSTL